MKEKILQIKAKNPKLGYKSIAKILNCSPNTVRYHLDNKVKDYYLARRKVNRRKIILKIKTMFGLKCQRCGYDKCLDALCFHHKDPTKKVDTINNMVTNSSWKDIVLEAKKCELLCSNCHIEEHYNIRELNGSLGGSCTHTV